MDSWLEENLVCPRDRQELETKNKTLVCPSGHAYPYLDGIPIMLLKEAPPTHNACRESLDNATVVDRVGRHKCRPTRSHEAKGNMYGCDVIDTYVQKEIAAACGIMYKSLVGRLKRYPIPELPMPQVSEKYFLDIGCNWGRWCISAARKGYIPVGVEVSLDAVRAARNVARSLGISANYIVADGRYLPFRDSSFDTVFSYSVLQHFDKKDAKASLAEASRVLKISGISLIQMANAFGLRNLYHQIRRKFKISNLFEVRYWNPSELVKVFTDIIGPTSVFADSYFCLDAQGNDMDILPKRYQFVIKCSQTLCKASRAVDGFKLFADSLYVKSFKR